MLINKKYIAAGLFVLCSSGSIFSAYFFQQKDHATYQAINPSTKSFPTENMGNEIHMSLFDQKNTTDFFDSSINLASEESKISKGENIGFLSLNKNTFIERLKTFVYKRIVEKNNSLLINSDNVSGKIFYSFLDQNTCDIVVKWKNSLAQQFQIFYDSFVIFIEY